MKFDQLIEYNKRNIFLKNEVGRLVPGSLLFFKKALYKVKAIIPQFGFNAFR